MAGLLTCFYYQRPSRKRFQWQMVRADNNCVKLTAAGLFGTFTRFPFHPLASQLETGRTKLLQS